MSAKSVITVDVDDSKFKEFQTAFAKYNAAVAKLPAQWQKVNAAAGAAGIPLGENADEAERAGKGAQKAATFMEKFRKAAATTAKSISSMAKSTSAFAKDMANATRSLLKWAGITGIISGILGAGGLFGIDRLAANAAQTRFRSQGLGVTGGELNSASINYGKAVSDVPSTLAAIRDAQNDLSKRWAFQAMGVNPTGKNSAQLLGPMIKAARDTFNRTGGTQQGAEAHGLTNFFSMEDLTRFKSMSDQEIDAMTQRYEKDREQLAVSDKTLKAWQDLNMQFERASQTIKNTFIQALVPLAPQLERLSAAFADAIKIFMQSPIVKKWIDGLADGIKTLAQYLGSDTFKSDLDAFLNALDVAGGAVYSFAKKINRAFGFFGGEVTLKASQYQKLEQVRQINPALADALTKQMENPHDTGYQKDIGSAINDLLKSGDKTKIATAAGLIHQLGYGSRLDAYLPRPATVAAVAASSAGDRHNPGNLRPASGVGFRTFGSDEEGIRAMAAQLKRYQARGIDTVGKIIGTYAPTTENDTAAYIRDVSGKMKVKADEKLNLNDPQQMAALISAMTKHENVRNNFPANTVVTILNNTGGNAAVSVNQLAQ